MIQVADNSGEARTIRTMKLVPLSKVVLAALSVTTGCLAHTENDNKLIDQDLSLPELSKLSSLELEDNWKLLGESKFDNGRILLTTKSNSFGSVLNNLPVAYDSFTIETIVRSLGAFGKETGGFSLRYVEEHNLNDLTFFGGSKRFKGLNVIVDSNGPLGGSIHAFLNDGTEDYSNDESLYGKAFGSCLLGYQSSQVPFTLRISYFNGVLIIQVNNKICIKTKQVKLPKNYQIGASASTHIKEEQFELMRFKTYGGVLSEILENDGKSGDQPKVVKEYVDSTTGEKLDIKENSDVKPSGKAVNSDDIQQTIDSIKSSNKEILNKFDSILNRINGLSAGSNNDFSYLDEFSKEIKQLNSKVSANEQNLNVMEASFKKFENAMILILKKQSDEQINQLRDNEQSIVELNKKIEYLVLSEKDRQENPIHDLISGLKLLILPIIVLVLLLSFLTYRLRHDIKSKLL